MILTLILLPWRAVGSETPNLLDAASSGKGSERVGVGICHLCDLRSGRAERLVRWKERQRQRQGQTEKETDRYTSRERDRQKCTRNVLASVYTCICSYHWHWQTHASVYLFVVLPSTN